MPAHRMRCIVLMVLLAFAAGPGPAGAQPAPGQDKDGAVRLATEGQQLYRSAKYGPALERFREAQKLYPSPDLLVYIAACLLNLTREPEAARVLLDYFAEPNQSDEALRGLALRLWHEMPGTARQELLAAGAEGLPPTVRRKLQRLSGRDRDQLPPQIQALLVPASASCTPSSARLEVDGEVLRPEDGMLHLTHGVHRLRCVPPPGTALLPAERMFDARPGAGPVNLVLLTPQRPPDSTPPPRLWPGLAVASAGIVAIGVGAALLAINDTCATPGTLDTCDRVYQTSAGGGAALGLGLATLAGGAIWFGVNAAKHPRFRRGGGHAPR